MATVYLAYDWEHHRKVAIKVLRLEGNRIRIQRALVDDYTRVEGP